MARKISFVNYKGGVGKTAMVVNVGAALAKLGKRVLIIDCDAQSNASVWLMRLDRWNTLNTQKRKGLLSVFIENGVNLSDVIVEDVVELKPGQPVLPGLDLAPTNFSLMDLEHEWEPSADYPFHAILNDQVRSIEKRYDYILFDCPPNVFRGTQSALFSSEEVVVPANPDALSLIGFSLFVEKSVRFHEQSHGKDFNFLTGKSKVTGVVLNAVKPDQNINISRQRMQMRMDHYRRMELVAPKAQVIPHDIRDASMVGRAAGMGVPLAILGKQAGDLPVRDDYRLLAEYIDINSPAKAG